MNVALSDAAAIEPATIQGARANECAVLTTDLDGAISGWSAGATRMFGWSMHEAVGRRLGFLHTPEEAASGTADRTLCLARALGRASAPTWHVGQDGKRFRTAGELTLLRVGDEAAGFAIVLCAPAGEEVTQTPNGPSGAEPVNESEASLRFINAALKRRVRQRTRELLHSEARFQAYFEASPEYLFLLRLTPDGRLILEDLNPAAQTLYDIRREDAIGRGVGDIVAPPRLAAIEQYARDCLRLGRPIRYEAEAPVSHGQFVTLNVVVAPLDLKDGRGPLILFCGRDLTDQRRVEDALRQSQKMEAVGQLTGGLAHDFNNLLAGISGSLELMHGRLAQGRIGELERYIATAQSAAKRAAALTHRLLGFSRRQALDPKPTDPNRLVRGMAELVQRTVGPEVRVEVICLESVWKTLVDPNQLENALLNLCLNARDAMPGGGRLTIETGNVVLDEQQAREQDMPPGECVSISVADSGAGMSAEIIARAFDPFFTTKPTGMGTGLGLSMVYGFARQSGGQAQIRSKPGAGTIISLYLPRHLGEMDSTEATSQPADAPLVLPGETALVVDDDPTVRVLVAEILGDLGFKATEAADATAGLDMLQSQLPVDLLVTDVGLPGMNGRQFADLARAIRPELQILFITGYAQHAVIGKGQLDGGMEVLTKPFTIAEMTDRIRTLRSGMVSGRTPTGGTDTQET